MSLTEHELILKERLINTIEDLTQAKKEETKTMQELNRTMLQLLGHLKVRKP